MPGPQGFESRERQQQDIVGRSNAPAQYKVVCLSSRLNCTYHTARLDKQESVRRLQIQSSDSLDSGDLQEQRSRKMKQQNLPSFQAPLYEAVRRRVLTTPPGRELDQVEIVTDPISNCKSVEGSERSARKQVSSSIRERHYLGSCEKKDIP